MATYSLPFSSDRRSQLPTTESLKRIVREEKGEGRRVWKDIRTRVRSSRSKSRKPLGPPVPEGGGSGKGSSSDSSSSTSTRCSVTPELSPRHSPVPFESGLRHGRQAMENWQATPASLSLAPVSHSGLRPSLDDVLADRSQPPYTLTAFMAYLSQNHCLETLEFTLDAKRYGEHYEAAVEEAGGSQVASECPKSQHLCMLFQRLLSAYIVPGAPREINLPSSVRDALLSHSHTLLPPPPSALDAAVKRMRDLMDDSIFIPFLNSRSSSLSRSLHDQGSIPRQRSTGQYSPSSMPLGLAPARTTGYRSSTHGSTSGDSGHLTDDTGSIPSSPGGADLMTPPTTPPSSDFQGSRGGRQENAWKKMGMRFGWKK